MAAAVIAARSAELAVELARARKDRVDGGPFSVVCCEAVAQVQAGAEILDVNVGMIGIDEVVLLPAVVKAVMGVVDVPLCLDSNNREALEAALNIYQGKAIVNSVSGREQDLCEILPLVRKSGAAVIGLTMDDRGIPTDADGRVAIAHRIVEQAAAIGIPPEDIIIDCITLTIGSNGKAGKVAIEAIGRVKTDLGVNQTLGASNISFGLPNRDLLNSAFIVQAITAGVTCPTVDAAKALPIVLATDLLLGRDLYAKRYIHEYRRAQTVSSSHPKSRV